MAGVYRVGFDPRPIGRIIGGAISGYRAKKAAEEEAARKKAEEARKAAKAAQEKADKALKEAQAKAIVSDPEIMKKLGDDAQGLTTDREQWDIWRVRTPGQRGSAESLPDVGGTVGESQYPSFRRGGARIDYNLPTTMDPTTMGRSAQEISDDITRFHQNKEDARNRKYIPSIRNPTPVRHGQAGAEQTLAELITRRRAEAERTLADLSAAGAKGARYEAIRRSKQEQGKQRVQDRVYKPGVQTIEEHTTALRIAEIKRTNAIKAAAAKEREKALKAVRSGGGKKKPKLTKREKLVKKYEERLAAEVEPGVPYLGIDIDAEKQKVIAKEKANLEIQKAKEKEKIAIQQANEKEKIAIQKELVAQSKKDIAELLAKGEARKKSLADRYEEVNRPWAVHGRDKGWADTQLKKSFAGGDPAIGETLPPHMRSFLGYPPKQVYDPATLEEGQTPPPGSISSEFLKEVATDFESHEKDALNQSWWEIAGEQAAYNGTTVREEYLKIREWAENGGVMVEVTENANGTLDATPMSKDHIRDNLKKDPRFIDTGESEVIRGEDGTLYERIGGLNYPLHPVTQRPGEFTGPAMREAEPIVQPEGQPDPTAFQGSWGYQAPGEPNFIPESYNVNVGAPAAYNLPPPTQVFRNLPPRRKPIGGFNPDAFGFAPRWART